MYVFMEVGESSIALHARCDTALMHLAAMCQATRIFASNLNERMAQRFYQAVLLPSVRSWMKETKHMPPHYFMAIRKAIFKQKAFIRGFLLPLVEEQDCGLREAMVVGSVLQKTSIKVLLYPFFPKGPSCCGELRCGLCWAVLDWVGCCVTWSPCGVSCVVLCCVVLCCAVLRCAAIRTVLCCAVCCRVGWVGFRVALCGF